MTEDPSDVLGVPTNADDATIRAAYRRCALLTHPDKGGSEEAFLRISRAFSALTDPLRGVDSSPGNPSKRRRVHPEGKNPKEAALARLEACIQSEPKEDRRELIEKLPPEVSQVLLQWMQLSQKPTSDGSPAPPIKAPKRQITPADSASDWSRSTDDQEQDGPSASACSTLLPSGGAVRGSKKACRTRCGNTGVHIAGGKSRQYQASVYCHNVIFVTSLVPNLEDAVNFHTVLVLVRNGFLSALTELGFFDVDAIANRVDSVITASCRVAGVDRVALGLWFRPVLSAVAEVGKQIVGQRTECLRSALEQRQQLVDAKAAGWHALSRVWVQMLSKQRTREEAQAIVNNAFKAHGPKRAKIESNKFRRQVAAAFKPQAQQLGPREWSDAVRSVARALRTEERNAEAAARAERVVQKRADKENSRRLDARRRWLSDRKRTAAELIAGPPADL